MERGIVYLLTNEVMEGLVKIGRCQAGGLRERLSQLNASTSLPLPFQVFHASLVPNHAQLEKALHEAFGHHRINPKREFFRVDPIRPRAMMLYAQIEEVQLGSGSTDPEGQAAILRQQERRPALNMHALGLTNGTVLVHTDDERITCEVTGPRTVRFNGEEMFLSRAARLAAEQRGRPFASGAYQGGQYWMHQGETLLEIRESHEERETAKSQGIDREKTA